MTEGELFYKLIISDCYDDVRVALSIWKPEYWNPTNYREIKASFREWGKEAVFVGVLSFFLTMWNEANPFTNVPEEERVWVN